MSDRLHFRLVGSTETMCGLANRRWLRSTQYYHVVNCPNCRRAFRDRGSKPLAATTAKTGVVHESPGADRQSPTTPPQGVSPHVP